MENIIYITPKFWPDKEHKNVPLDEHVDYNNPYKVLEHRQKIKLFYLNWVEVWRTYVYFSKWAIGLVPLVFLLTNSLWATGIVFLVWIICRIYFIRKLRSLIRFKFLASGIIDPYIVPYLGPVEPFE